MKNFSKKTEKNFKKGLDFSFKVWYYISVERRTTRPTDTHEPPDRLNLENRKRQPLKKMKEGENMKHYGFDNYSECAEYYLANPAKKFKRGGVNTGAKGCIFECVVRHAVNGVWEHVHVMDETDVTIKRGVTLECKSGAGDLTSAKWTSREEATEVWGSSKRPMRKASHVCYTVKVNVENPAEMLETARVFTQNEFIQILEESKMLRFRKDGEKFCAAIQTVSESTAKSQFLKNGQPRKETAPNKFRRLILERGETLESFIERMGK